jgi:hypothetical protein
MVLHERLAPHYFVTCHNEIWQPQKECGLEHLLCFYSYSWRYDKYGWYVAIPSTPCQVMCNFPDAFDYQAKLVKLMCGFAGSAVNAAVQVGLFSESPLSTELSIGDPP